MTQSEQLIHIQNINKQCVDILKSKGHDYAANEDILKNFKEMRQMCDILKIDISRVEGIHVFYILLKIQRLCNIMFGSKQAKNESLQDTLLDLRNYVDLLNCALEEKKPS